MADVTNRGRSTFSIFSIFSIKYIFHMNHTINKIQLFSNMTEPTWSCETLEDGDREICFKTDKGYVIFHECEFGNVEICGIKFIVSTVRLNRIFQTPLAIDTLESEAIDYVKKIEKL